MSCGHDHHEHGASAGQVAEQLALAAGRIEACGERFTAPRRRVLELLLADGGPVKAYDLMARYRDRGRPGQAAHRLSRPGFPRGQGLVHRLASLGAFVACRLGEDVHAAGFLICDCCGAAQEIESDAPRDGARRRPARLRGAEGDAGGARPVRGVPGLGVGRG